MSITNFRQRLTEDGLILDFEAHGVVRALSNGKDVRRNLRKDQIRGRADWTLLTCNAKIYTGQAHYTTGVTSHRMLGSLDGEDIFP